MITKGDVEEDEDLCAVPPHIMRIMQVQNMSTISVLMLMMIKSVTLVMGEKVIRKAIS